MGSKQSVQEDRFTLPAELTELRQLNFYRSRLRQKVAECKQGKLSFKRTAEICMLSRALSAEYLALWLTGHQPPAPTKAEAIEGDLDAAVQAVRMFYRSGLAEAEKEKVRVQNYLVNESARVSRIKGLHDGPEVFHQRLEAQRKGIAQARREEKSILPVLRPTAPGVRSGRSIPTAQKAVELPSQMAGAPLVRLCRRWFEQFYFEVNQFLFEIEASPYLDSAKQQAKTVRGIWERSKLFLDAVASFAPAERSLDAAGELLDSFEERVVTPLEKATRTSEEESSGSSRRQRS